MIKLFLGTVISEVYGYLTNVLFILFTTCYAHLQPLVEYKTRRVLLFFETFHVCIKKLLRKKEKHQTPRENIHKISNYSEIHLIKKIWLYLFANTEDKNL